jgi:hypothetical protein
MDPLPLHSGQGIVADVFAICTPVKIGSNTGMNLQETATTIGKLYYK